MEKSLEKKIPTKNYVLLAVIVGLTILVVFYARNWYIMTKVYNNQSPMLNTISEINKDEINNYILENQKFVLYVSSGSNSYIKGFEKRFNNYVIDKNLSYSMLYLNTDTINKEEFDNQLEGYAISGSIKEKINVNNDVSMYLFENGKITEVINKAQNLTIKKIDKLFKKYGMIDNA